jgi:hypothetical protein
VRRWPYASSNDKGAERCNLEQHKQEESHGQDSYGAESHEEQPKHEEAYGQNSYGAPSEGEQQDHTHEQQVEQKHEGEHEDDQVGEHNGDQQSEEQAPGEELAPEKPAEHEGYDKPVDEAVGITEDGTTATEESKEKPSYVQVAGACRMPNVHAHAGVGLVVAVAIAACFF